MSKTLDSILAAPPLTQLPGVPRVSPGAQEAMASVAALAAQQAADLPASASPFEPAPETPERFSFSFSLDTEDRIFDVASARSLLGEVTKSGGVFKATIHF
jgi:hypothetical protein